MGWNEKLSPLTLSSYNEDLLHTWEKMEALELLPHKEIPSIKGLFNGGHFKSLNQFVNDFDILRA